MVSEQVGQAKDHDRRWDEDCDDPFEVSPEPRPSPQIRIVEGGVEAKIEQHAQESEEQNREYEKTTRESEVEAEVHDPQTTEDGIAALRLDEPSDGRWDKNIQPDELQHEPCLPEGSA